MNNSHRIRAKQILQLYAAGERNFQHRDLSGLVFNGQDLSEADFSHSDIRGTDFSKATLVGTHFEGVQAGVGRSGRLGAKFISLSLGLLSGFLGTRIAVPIVSATWDGRIGGMVSLAFLIVCCFLIRKVGLLLGVVLTVGGMALLGTLAAVVSVSLDLVTMGYTILEIADAATLAIASIAILCLFLPISRAAGHRGTISYVSAVASAVSVPLLADGPIAENLGIGGTVLAVGLAIALVQFCQSIAQQAIAGHPRQALIHNFAVAAIATIGTKFRHANIAYANFSNADLKHSDFRAYCLTYTRWDQVTGLAWVRWGKWPMSNLAIQNLLTTRSSQGNRDLAGANLTATDLSGIDLQQANLKGANLIEAKLCGADLTRSNLSLVQALGTDFTEACLTGSCIEGWAIDSGTRLENIKCAFVYRLETAKFNSDDRERQPSSGEFESGDFTQLFRVVLNTVEFIFRSGIDREALAIALNKIQASYSQNINLQGIEDKGNGSFKVTLDVPQHTDKAAVHQDFKNIYKDHIEQIESQYQTQLRAAQQQIEHYQQTTTDLTTVLKQLTEKHDTNKQDLAQHHPLPSESQVTITFWDGSLDLGYPITADIRVGTSPTPFKFHASLPPAPELLVHHQQWQSLYRQTFSTGSRIQINSQQVTNVSCQELAISANRLSLSLQAWMRSPAFRSIADKLREKFLPDQEIQVIIQTEDTQLRRLPWHLWKFLDDYPKAEVALSGMALETTSYRRKPKDQLRVLAILGNDTGINIEIDQQLWQKLDRSKVNVYFLRKPNRQQFHEHLWDHQGWDALYFSGHSYSDPDGHDGIMQLNPFDKISIEDLRFALKKAVNRGLQLAILNSCDGLGLARELCSLKIPQVIVMKEPVPDKVAHSFLAYFLQAMTQASTFSSAFRDARQQLSGLEDKYPYASWLPTLFQTGADVSFPQLKTPELE